MNLIQGGRKSDDLEDTVDYVKLISIVEEQMAIRSNMIEHVAARIAIKYNFRLCS